MLAQIKTCRNCAYLDGDICLRTGYNYIMERQVASYAHTMGIDNVTCNINFSGWIPKDQPITNQPKDTEMTASVTPSLFLCTMCHRLVGPNFWSTYPHLMHFWCWLRHKATGCNMSAAGYCYTCGNKTK